MNWQAFFQIHRDLPREGPGSDEATLEALNRLRAVAGNSRLGNESAQPAADLRVFDLGCGPGKQTLVLARELRSRIIAVDNHEPFLTQLRRSASDAGLGDLVELRLGKMEELGEPPGSIDLIWCEGAIYNVGFEAGLRLWRPMLRDHGSVVASEATWLADDPPAECRDFWTREYPPMTNFAGNAARAAEAGFDVVDHLVLPRAAWWDEYLTPIEKRIALLRPKATADLDLAEVLKDHEREVDMCRRFGDCFGYVFYIMRKTDGG